GYYLPDKPISVLKGMFRLTHRFPHPSMREKNQKIFPHEVEVNLGLLGLLGLGEEPERLTRLYISGEELESATNFLREHGVINEPLIMWHLPLKWEEDGWNRDYLLKLADGLSGLIFEARLLITCGPGEEKLLMSLENDLPEGSIAARGLNFRTWAGLFPHCRLVISRDCGAVHVAAALGVPVINVFEEFKRKEHRRWTPWAVPHVNIFRPEKVPPGGFDENISQIISAARQLLGEDP
ncbi:MAG: hypothetical protein J7M18_05500, partial [Candidatus Eremiobacteraeota bacterium]|nr:hypothetical protein [Candidatus Eremiobacteraeota bacterium]